MYFSNGYFSEGYFPTGYFVPAPGTPQILRDPFWAVTNLLARWRISEAFVERRVTIGQQGWKISNEDF